MIGFGEGKGKEKTIEKDRDGVKFTMILSWGRERKRLQENYWERERRKNIEKRGAFQTNPPLSQVSLLSIREGKAATTTVTAPQQHSHG